MTWQIHTPFPSPSPCRCHSLAVRETRKALFLSVSPWDPALSPQRSLGLNSDFPSSAPLHNLKATFTHSLGPASALGSHCWRVWCLFMTPGHHYRVDNISKEIRLLGCHLLVSQRSRLGVEEGPAPRAPWPGVNFIEPKDASQCDYLLILCLNCSHQSLQTVAWLVKLVLSHLRLMSL